MPAMNAAEGFGGDAMQVDPATLATIAGTLDDAGFPLLGCASALQTAPDAGASSGLVADAMEALATAVAGLSGHIGDLASSTGVAAPLYVDTDHGSELGLRAVLP
jgi:hypothetical protein